MSISAAWLYGVLVLAAVLATGWWIHRIYILRRSIAQENDQLSRRLATALEELDRRVERVQELEMQREESFQRFRHDCMNPLGSISGFLSLLQDAQCGELNSRQRRYIESVERSTQSLLRLFEKTSTANSSGETKTALAPYEGELQGKP